MKKILILLSVLLVLLLTGCQGDNHTAGSEPHTLNVLPEDQNQTCFWPNYFETSEGYYFGFPNSASDESVELIYFCPRGEKTFYPLCSKPNCKHNGTDCNAWYGSNFGYYNGSIYAVDFYDLRDGISLVKMNLDGTNHQVVAAIDDSELKNQGVMFMFHHGKLFIQGVADSDLPLEEQEDHLIVLNLSDYTQTEPLKDYLGIARLPVFICCYMDKLYGIGTTDKNLDYSFSNSKLIEIDSNTGEICTPFPRYISGVYVTDSSWYYYEPDMSGLDENCENHDAGFREYDTKSGTIKDCGLPVEDIQWARRDESFVYAGSFSRNNGNDRTIYFFSEDYTLIDQIELKNGINFAVAASDRIFFYDESSMSITGFLDKSQIGNGKLSLIPIETAE